MLQIGITCCALVLATAPKADSAISAGVTGRFDDIGGVCIDPATEMMTLCDAMAQGSPLVPPTRNRQQPLRARTCGSLVRASR
jgi:hypothetical protein